MTSFWLLESFVERTRWVLVLHRLFQMAAVAFRAGAFGSSPFGVDQVHRNVVRLRVYRLKIREREADTDA